MIVLITRRIRKCRGRCYHGYHLETVTINGNHLHLERTFQIVAIVTINEYIVGTFGVELHPRTSLKEVVVEKGRNRGPLVQLLM